MSRIFISHSSANNAAALAVAQWLRDNGWDDYFLDMAPTRGLAPGDRWQEALKAAAHRCEAVLFLISPAWRDSRWCLAEFLLAKSLGKVIFGVLVEPTPIETLLPEMTAEWQVCDLATGEGRASFQVSQDPIVPPTLVSFARAGLERLKLGLQKAGLDASTFLWPPANQRDRSPYPGLRPLEAEDAAVFFGRDAAIVRGLDELRGLQERGVERMLVILGASGAGKSSFLRAGLWPRLERDDRRFLPLPVIRPERTAISGTTGLAASFEVAFRKLKTPNAKPRTRAEIRATLRQPGGLDPFLRELQGLGQASAAMDTPAPTVVIPVDQAEELFATEGRAEGEDLLSRLGEVLAPPTGEDAEAIAARRRCLAVLAMRSDSYEHLQTEPRLAQVKTRLFDLRPMEPQEYKSVIEGPAARATSAGSKLAIEPRLTERLLEDTEGADALPLLAFTLERLVVQYGADGDLTLKEYEDLGAVRGSIEAAIAAALAEPERQPTIPSNASERDRLLRLGFIPWLARVDPDTEERKRRVARWDEIPEAARPLLARLVEARLLTKDRRRVAEGDQETDVVEIAHEALLRQWPSLTTWLDEEAGHLKAAEAVRRAAREWILRDRRVEWLVHTGERLADAESLRDHEGFAKLLAEEGLAYLRACRERDEAARRQEEEAHQRELSAAEQQAEAERRARLAESRRLKWTRRFAVVASVLLALAAWSYIRVRRESARTRQALADAAFSRAVSVADQSPAEALAQLALAMRMQRQLTAPRSLAANLLTSAPRLLEVLEHQGSVGSAAFSPDGTRIVTASDDKTARVWDARTGEAVGKPLVHVKSVIAASFSTDGNRVVTASQDKTARVWDARTGEAVGKPLVHQGEVWSASFSPDGSRVVTASQDMTARVWDTRTGEAVGKPLVHMSSVIAAVFSPDGNRVVTASQDSTARVWDARTGERLGWPMVHQGLRTASFSLDGSRIVTASDRRGYPEETARLWDAQVWDLGTGEGWNQPPAPLGKPIEHDGVIEAAAFSPDGTRIVTASADRTARVWDARTGAPVSKPLQHRDRVVAAAFSPDGTRVLTASADQTARAWDAWTGEPLGWPLQHQGPVRAAAFSPDGSRIVTASRDGTARVWDARTTMSVATPFPHESGAQMKSSPFSPDGSHIVTAVDLNTARAWDVRSGEPIGKPVHHHGSLQAASFAADGSRVVAASQGDTVRVWDARTGEAVGKPLLHQGTVWSVSFSPDGSRVVTASEDKTARVWDARTGKAVGKPLVHQGRVLSASFSPDGSRVVTASLDNTARVWNARTGKAVGKPLVHQGEVWSASFSPDGSRVVTASLDNTARVWNARTGEPIAGPVRHQGPITAASFSPDGTRIVTASMDGTARVWDAATGEPLAKPLQQPSQLDLVADAVAAFSPDGSRVVTALCDKTAGVWDARTGEPLAVLRDQYAIATAAFSPDGNRIVTIPLDVRGGARVWDSLLFSDAEADTLAELAETAVGFTVTDLGVLVALPDRKERLSHLRSAASAAPDGQATVLSFARWLFSDPWTRTISPLSAVTVPQYICDAIRRGAVEEAQRAFPGHPLLRGSPSPVAVPPECPPSRP